MKDVTLQHQLRYALIGLLLTSTPLWAEDVPAPTQKIGNHSTVATTDGSIRDDELVDFICDQIKENGGKVKDVKLMVNSCYGGGILDDMERAFGPGGACEGIPWVGGSASGPEQTARGWKDQYVNDFPDEKLGSMWTDGLVGKGGGNVGAAAGSIYDGSSTNNVMQDLKSAGDKDRAGPNGSGKETPHVASGNNGDQIMWNMEGAKHEAVVFGGLQTNPRHHNNINNVKAALEKTWGTAPHNIKTIDGGSSQDLKDAIEAAAKNLDENTQLVVYIDDHGGSSFDFDEAIGGIADILIEDPVSHPFEVPPGWIEGFFGNYFAVPNEFPSPFLMLDITECDRCSNWGYYINGEPLFFPGGDQTGHVMLPIPFWQVREGDNLLDIMPAQTPGTQASNSSKAQTHFGSLRVSRMEVDTGPVNELLIESLLLPGQSAAYFDLGRNGEGIFLELLDNNLVVVYVFTYTADGTGQAWMIGVGEQTGEGIIITEMLRPTGPSFGPGYDPDDVVLNPFGYLAFHLPTCGGLGQPGSIFMTPGIDSDYESMQDFNYGQLSQIVDCPGGGGHARAGWSGSWFDPSHNGEGIILQILPNGVVVVQWFTYDSNGNQMWVQGTGTISGDTITVTNLFTTGGTAWGSGFNANDVVNTPWGTLTMVFGDCNSATVNYNSTQGFGSGILNMVRLSSLMGIACEE